MLKFKIIIFVTTCVTLNAIAQSDINFITNKLANNYISNGVDNKIKMSVFENISSILDNDSVNFNFLIDFTFVKECEDRYAFYQYKSLGSFQTSPTLYVDSFDLTERTSQYLCELFDYEEKTTPGIVCIDKQYQKIYFLKGSNISLSRLNKRRKLLKYFNQ
jgi:hypothetical protein